MLLTTHPLLALRSWKSRAIYTSVPLWATTGPVMGLLYLLLLKNCLSLSMLVLVFRLVPVHVQLLNVKFILTL